MPDGDRETSNQQEHHAMKLGLDTAYSGAHMALPIEKILLAEKLGFDSVWASEAYGSDAFTPLAYVAALTKTIRLGTGIAQIAARTPANLAMVAQTLDALAGEGRVIVGLGVSGPQIVEGWYGQPWGKPAARIRDYVAIARKIWRREGPVAHQGEEISLPYTGPGATGLGKPLKSILHGNPNIPIVLGTSTPGNIRMTGEIADGWLSMHVTPETAPGHLKTLGEGIAKRSDGKTLKDFEIITNINLTVTDDVKAALDKGRPAIALYVGGMGAQGKNFHKDAMVARGFAAEADRIQDLFLAGRKAEAEAAVPDAFLDDGALIGPPARIKQRFARWRDAGFTLLRFNNPTQEAMEVIAGIARG
jgi:F420-dependent oxidoreductase-like protein